MTSQQIELPSAAPGEDHLALAAEFQQLHHDVLRSNEIERKLNGGIEVNKEDLAFLSSIPEKMRRAVDITRILRRTNTGPAKVKEKTGRVAKKALAQSEIDKLIDL